MRPLSALKPQLASSARALAALEDVVRTTSSTLAPQTLLQRAVEAIASASGQRDAYAYLFDEEHQRLVLSAGTTALAAEHAGRLTLELGQGAAGWAAASREPYAIRGDLSDDRRFAFRAELGEDRYDGLLCVPVVARDDRLIGVVTLYARPGEQLDDETLTLAERAVGLVAGALEGAQTHAAAEHRAQALQHIAKVSAITTSGLTPIRVLDVVTELARGAVGAALAVMIVANPAGDDRLILKSLAPATSADERRLAHRIRRELLAVDARVRRGGVTWPMTAEDINARMRAWFDTVATTPLRVAGEELGVLCCYRASGPRFGDEEHALLATIANQAALALKAAQLAEELVEHNELGRFVREVAAGRLDTRSLREHAAALGLDASGAYCFVVASVAFEQRSRHDVERGAHVLRQVAHRLGELDPGARCATSVQEVVALLPRRAAGDWPAHLRTKLTDLHEALRRRAGVLVTFGISRATGSLDDVRAALAEAREAAAAGADGGGGVFTLDDVSHQLLLRRAADNVVARDRYSLAISTIAEYDRVKSSALLHTLSVFLHVRNRSDAARELFVHRNTLAQRLRRIQELTDVDVADADEWFPLQLALKIHLLRNPLVDAP